MNDELLETLGYESLLSELANDDRTREWAKTLRVNIEAAFTQSNDGNLPRWLAAFAELPRLNTSASNFASDAVTATGEIDVATRERLRATLMQFHPWRKGPFELFDVRIDTEWRSDWKWQRLQSHVDLRGKSVLDVGCGNGYYGWRMLAAGARRVVGLDPFLLYVVQAAVVRRYLGDAPNYIVPGSDALIAKDLRAFDAVFSMGVLYHRTSPIDHLQSLCHALVRGGDVIVETLVLEGDGDDVLVPDDRYAQMRNVWFIPTTTMLERWLARCGFCDIRTVDITRTTTNEQRPTAWMHFESLASFLDPTDSTKTIEGYPAPVRAIVTAKKK